MEMGRGRLVLRCLACVAIFAAPLVAQPRIRFTGAVRAGETFRKTIGSGLVFVLTPNGGPYPDEDSGWTIEVQPMDESDPDNFIRCVIEPIHGPTPADILTSQFVTEGNKKRSESKLDYPKRREFQFVLNDADQKKACDELDVVAYGQPTTAKDGTVIIGTPGYKEPPLGSGRLLIKTMELSNLGKGKHARIESLRFETEIEFPGVERARSSEVR